jgi:hypothetical protein
MRSFSIRIVDEYGNGVEDVWVRVNYSGSLGSSVHEELTDSDGWAKFDTFKSHVEEVEVKNPAATDYYTEVTDELGNVSDDDTFSFTLPDEQK